jgi:hypothetical protein
MLIKLVFQLLFVNYQEKLYKIGSRVDGYTLNVIYVGIYHGPWLLIKFCVLFIIIAWAEEIETLNL